MSLDKAMKRPAKRKRPVKVAGVASAVEVPRAPAHTHIEGCRVEQHAAPFNEHTAATLVAIAKAAEKNAEAINTIARAITGAGGTFGAGMYIGASNAL